MPLQKPKRGKEKAESAITSLVFQECFNLGFVEFDLCRVFIVAVVREQFLDFAGLNPVRGAGRERDEREV